MPVRMLATTGTVADCTQAEALLDDIAAEYLLADRGYETKCGTGGGAGARDGTGTTAEAQSEGGAGV